jgi:hypothetical protein
MGQYVRSLICVMMLRGPSTCISNSSPSQTRFNESAPRSQSYDLFYEGSQKHHSRTLGFDDLICDLPCSDIVLVTFVVKSVTVPEVR